MPAPNREVSKFTPDQRDHALLTLYLCGGNSIKASQQCGIGASTLRYWAQEHRARYDELAAKHAPQLEKIVLNQLQRGIVAAGDAYELALQKTQEQLEAGQVKDPASTARNLAVARGVDIDKTLLIQGRPTQITEHRDISDLVRALESTAPGLVVDSTAEDA